MQTRTWIDIREQKPEEEQDVFYYFEFCGVCSGKYQTCKLGTSGIVFDCFYGKSGFLCDDVQYWMPRKEYDEVPLEPFHLNRDI